MMRCLCIVTATGLSSLVLELKYKYLQKVGLVLVAVGMLIDGFAESEMHKDKDNSSTFLNGFVWITLCQLL